LLFTSQLKGSLGSRVLGSAGARGSSWLPVLASPCWVLTPHGRRWPVMGIHLLSKQVSHCQTITKVCRIKKLVPDLHIFLEVNIQFVCKRELKQAPETV